MIQLSESLALEARLFSIYCNKIGCRLFDGYVEQEDEDNDNLEIRPPIEKKSIFFKYHNSIVGHFGIVTL